MRIDEIIKCQNFPCKDVNHSLYIVPNIEFKPERISIAMISEAAPSELSDYYYAGGEALFQQTTLLAFQDAGINVSSIEDIVNRGIYLTTAVKCGKIGYGIKAGTIHTCSHLLEYELAYFPNLKVLMLMGDVAIKSINTIARRNGENRPIPAGSTYKIRGQEYYFRGKRLFPSYLQAGPAFFIEKSKRKMIAEDISQALSIIN